MRQSPRVAPPSARMSGGVSSQLEVFVSNSLSSCSVRYCSSVRSDDRVFLAPPAG
jgi:hypothetical protein